MSNPNSHAPTDVRLHQHSRTLELQYSEEEKYSLSCEYLRVFSPSAEVRGHGPGQEVLQTGKKHVAITRVIPVGQYALQFVYSDGHDSGIYSWDYLYWLATHFDENWQQYIDQLEEAGASREPAGPAIIVKN
jgi:DUF971 family protein